MEKRRERLAEHTKRLDDARAAALAAADREAPGGYPIRAFVINLEGARERLDGISRSLSEAGIAFERVPGIKGSDLSDYATRRLAPTWERALEEDDRAGTLGCFLGHIGAWERVANGDGGFYLVLEDDARPCVPIPRSFSALKIPEDVDLCFCNTRMEPLFANGADYPTRPKLLTAVEARGTRPADQRGIGGEAYFLSKRGAEKLLQAVDIVGAYKHVDWFLMMVGIDDEAAKTLRDNDRARKIYKRTEARLGAVRHIRFRMVSLWPSLMSRTKGVESTRKTENVA
jgi:GR25 family glycosyltransferase involved in LPS biosynthesis